MNREFITIKEATEEEKKRRELDNRLSKQEKLSWQIIIGVVIAFLFVVGTVSVEVILFHTRANKDFLDLQNQYFQEIKDMQKNQFEMELRLQKEIDLMKPENYKSNK